MINFVIARSSSMNSDEPVFWSNELGWVSYDDATIFTEKERDELNLPEDGIWCSDVSAILAMQ